MKVACTRCGFEGNIKDELIPAGGRNVSCPKCKNTIFVKKVETRSDELVLPEIKRSEIIKPKLHVPPRQIRDTKSLLLKIGLSFLIFTIVFIIGFFSGLQYYKSKYSINEKDAVKLNDLPNKPQPPKLVVPPPTSPPIPETTPDKLQPNWEDVKSDVNTDISQIDSKIVEWENSKLTDLQKDDEMKTYGDTFLGTNLKGYLKVTDVRSGRYNNLIFPGLDDSFPDQTFKYVIEAENLYPVTQWSYMNNKVMLGVKGNEDFVKSLSKDTKIYAEGFIYAWKWSGSSYELFLINCKVNMVE